MSFLRRRGRRDVSRAVAREEERAQASQEGLQEDLEHLRRALEIGGDMLPADAVARAQDVLRRADERRSFTTGRTVVALMGATGSGKSSIANTIAGRTIARVAARRPTTTEPLAAIWGEDDAGPVLDWLDIKSRVQVNRPRELPVGPGGEDLSGLVLVDMPDVDSTEIRHRKTTARLAQSVDVLLWVLDPQKYADAAIHHEFLAPMAEHAQVTLVVLNQVDTLEHEERERILADLREILAEDGLPDVEVLAVSAVTEEGIPSLFGKLEHAVSTTRSAHERLRADVRTAARNLVEEADIDLSAAVTEASAPKDVVERLVAASAAAAGEQAVTGAVERSYRRHAYAHVGWVPVRWLAGFGSDPMKNLHLEGADLDPDLVRSSLPAATPVQEAGVRSAAQSLATRAGEGLPDRWRARLMEGTDARIPRAVADLDGAIVGTDTENTVTPAWWKIIGALHWVAFAALLGGVLWLLAVAAGSYLQFEIATPVLGPVPWPVVLVVGGLMVGLLLWWVGGVAARSGGRARAERVRGRIRERVADSVRASIVKPIEDELATYGALRRELRHLQGVGD